MTESFLRGFDGILPRFALTAGAMTCLCFGLGGPGPALAQVPVADTVLSIPELGEQTVEGALEDSDPMAGDRHYDEFRVRLTRGEDVQIDMESDEFDTYLEIWRPGEVQPSATNDDRESGSTNARLFFSAPDEGDYVVRALDFFEGRGRYRITLTRLAATARAEPLPTGVTSGEIRADSPVVADPERAGRGLRYRDFAFQGQARQRVSIDMTSGDFDSQLALMGPDGALIAADDDSGEGSNNARIVVVLPSTGLYVLRASGPANRAGHFRLVRHVNQPMPTVTAATVPLLQLGQVIECSLDEASPVRMRRGERGRIDYFYRLYRLRVTAGRPVTLTMSSPDFDPLLEAGTLFPVLGFAAAERNDDGGRGNSARLVLEPLQSGLVYLRVRSSGAGRGAYTLRVLGDDSNSMGSASVTNERC